MSDVVKSAELHCFVFTSNSLFTEPQCCLTFPWIRLQRCVGVAFLHITVIILAHILFLKYLCPCLDLVHMYVVSMWSIFHFLSLFHYNYSRTHVIRAHVIQKIIWIEQIFGSPGATFHHVIRILVLESSFFYPSISYCSKFKCFNSNAMISKCFEIFKFVWIRLLVADAIKMDRKRKHHEVTLKVKYKALK